MLRFRFPLPRLLGPREVVLGPKSISALRALDSTMAFVYISQALSRNEDAMARLRKSMGSLNAEFHVAVSGEPQLERLTSALAHMNDCRPDWIVAVGGGSVMDGAKILWCLYEHPDLNWQQALRPFGLPGLRGKARLVCVPTTAGTGSEASSAAAFHDAETGSTSVLVSHDFLPDIAILDPELATGVPSSVRAASGLDALSHAIESYVSIHGNPLADMFSEKAAEVLFDNLVSTAEQPQNRDAYLAVMNAALLAGQVQNLKVPGLGHAMAHQIGRYGVPHGRACGAFLAPSIEINSEDPQVAEKYRKLARSLGLADEESLVRAVQKLRKDLGENQPLGSLIEGGAARVWADLTSIERGASQDLCARANPRPVDAALIKRMLQAAL